MTVPTNNEDRDATAEQKAWDELARLTSGVGPAANWRWSIPANPDRDSDLILAAGLKALADERDALAARRLPVSGDNAALIEELRNVECYYGGELRDWMRDSVKRAADILSASQPREAAPSDTDREALIEEAERVYDGAVLHDDVDYEVGLIQRLGLALARTSHPVQVEVTEALVDRAYRGWFTAKSGGQPEGVYEATFSRAEFEWMRAALSAALGGGDQ